MSISSKRNSALDKSQNVNSQSHESKGTKESKTSTTLEPEDIKAGIFGNLLSKLKFPAKFKEKYIKVNKEEIIGECFYCLRPKCYVLKPSCGHGCCYACSSFLIDFSQVIENNKGIKCLHCEHVEQMTDDHKTTLEYLKYWYLRIFNKFRMLNFGPDYGNENIVSLKDGKANIESEGVPNPVGTETDEIQYCNEHLDK